MVATRSVLPCLAVALLALAPQAARAQADNPTGEELMREMAHAFERTASIRTRAAFHAVGPLMLSTPRGEVELSIDHAGGRRRVSLHGELTRFPSGERIPVRVVLDDELRALDPGARTWAAGPLESQDEILPDELGRVFRWLWLWDTFVADPFGPGDEAFEAERLGTTIIEGTECDVVRVDYSAHPGVEELDLYWFIARSDRLPRRIEATYFFGDATGVGVTTLREIRTGPALAESDFAFEPPEGFTRRTLKGANLPGAGGGGAAPQGPFGIPVGEIAPDWVLKDPAGNEHRLSDYRGRVVLLDFWATWCRPCTLAMPGLQALHEELGPKGLAVLGLNSWDEPGAGEAYMREQEFTYTTLLNAEPVAQDYRVSAIPTFYLIAPDGRVVLHEVGYSPQAKDTLSKTIATLLAGGE